MLRFTLLLLWIVVAVAGAGKEPAKTECLAADEELSSFVCLKTPPLRIPCVDNSEECPNWAGRGECTKNPQFMLIDCRSSCKSCIERHHGGVLQMAPDENLSNLVMEKLVETQEYQHEQAKLKVESLKTCYNKHEMCTHWAIIGDCERNKHFMTGECAPACQTCDAR